MVESGPMPAIHGVVDAGDSRDLAMWVWEEFRGLGERDNAEPDPACARLSQARPAPAIMPRPRERSTLLKRSPSKRR